MTSSDVGQGRAVKWMGSAASRVAPALLAMLLGMPVDGLGAGVAPGAAREIRTALGTLRVHPGDASLRAGDGGSGGTRVELSDRWLPDGDSARHEVVFDTLGTPHRDDVVVVSWLAEVEGGAPAHRIQELRDWLRRALERGSSGRARHRVELAASGVLLVSEVAARDRGGRALEETAPGIVAALSGRPSPQAAPAGEARTAPGEPPGRLGGCTLLSVDGGGSHSVAVRDDGSVWTWGASAGGQLGDGTATSRLVPVQVLAPGSGVTAARAAEGHTIALKGDGSVWAWGANGAGQLGDGSNTDRYSPVPVLPAGSGVTSVGGDAYHSLAVKGDGSLLAWGSNAFGQIGDGTKTRRSSPVTVFTAGSGIVAAAGGADHTLAIKGDGSVWAWGSNFYGQLGNGTKVDQLSPIQVLGPGSGVSRVAAGSRHSLALKSDGSVWAWGENAAGQLGDGTFTTRLAPVVVLPAGSGVIGIAAGSYHSLALKGDGSVWSWGWNFDGELGDGTITNRPAPVQVLPPGSGVVAVAAGSLHSLVRRSDGSVLAWGRNSWGQLGVGVGDYRPAPGVVPVGPAVVAIAAGRPGGGGVAGSPPAVHSLALESDGSVWAWGSNDYGQVGDGLKEYRYAPVQVFPSGSGVVGIAAGSRHSLAVKQDGSVWAWGANNRGQLGDGTTTERLVPTVALQPGSLVTAVYAGHEHSFARLSDGSLWAWGANARGQLGDGSTTGRSRPVRILPPETGDLAMVLLSTGGNYTLITRKDGSLWGWGANSEGQLGDGTTGDRTAPFSLLPVGTGVSAIAAGDSHSLLVRSDSSLWVWGSNLHGQLGDGTRTGRLVPFQLVGPGSGITSVAAGSDDSLALKGDGSLWAWGANFNGFLGNGSTTVDVLTPTQVVGPGSGLAAIVASTDHTLGLRSSGSLWVWGVNGGHGRSYLTVPVEPLRCDFSPRLLLVGTPLGVEGNCDGTSIRFPVVLDRADPVNSVSVGYTVSDGTAKAGSDFSAVSGTLTFAPGETNKSVAIPLVGDTLAELDETLNLVLASPVNVSAASPSNPGTIRDDDPNRPDSVWNGFFAVDTRETPYVGDFDGNGMDDIITFSRDNPLAYGDVYVSLSTGSEFGQNQKWHDWFAIDRFEAVVIGDFDGDGRDDIATWLQNRTKQVYVARSKGTGLLPASVWLDFFGSTPADVLISGDANGDGRDDLILFIRTEGRVVVSLSTGSSFLAPTEWHRWFAVSTWERPAVADVNGDGKADILTFATDSPTAFGDVYVALSTGNRFEDGVASRKWHDFFSIDPLQVIRLGDLNGDGKADVFTFMPRPSSQVYTAQSHGTFLGPNVLVDIPRLTRNASDVPYVGDVDGDGRADIIVFHQEEGKVRVHRAICAVRPEDSGFVPPVLPPPGVRPGLARAEAAAASAAKPAATAGKGGRARRP